MTEWEKLQAGLIYNGFDRELFDRRAAAKKLFRAYNRTEDGETALRQELLAKLFRSLGRNVWIEPDFRCEFGRNIAIGDNTCINFGCVILDCAAVTIGDGAIVGTGSVVTKDIPAGVVALGNPCRVVRKITESDKWGFPGLENL